MLQKNKLAFEKVTRMIKQRKYAKNKSCRLSLRKNKKFNLITNMLRTIYQVDNLIDLRVSTLT